MSGPAEQNAEAVDMLAAYLGIPAEVLVPPTQVATGGARVMLTPAEQYAAGLQAGR